MQQQKLDPVKIEKLRKKRFRKRLSFILAIVLVVGAVLAYVTGIYDAMASVMRDVVDTISVELDKGDGFPMAFTLPGFKTASELVGGFTALGEMDFVIVSPSGKELSRIQHGYARPAIAVGGTRVALYNLAGTELKIQGRSGTLFKKIFAQPIQSVAISKGGSFAVTTRSARYEAELTVYNSLFKEEYFWFSASDTPINTAISQSGDQVAVLCASPKDGALGGTVYMLDLSLDSELAKIDVPQALPISCGYLASGDLCVVYDSFVAVYNGKTGEEMNNYTFGGSILQKIDISDKYIALTMKTSSSSSASTVQLIDANMTLMCEINVPLGARDVCLTRTNIYIAANDKVQTYGLDGVLWGDEILSSPCEYIINAKSLLALTRTEVIECNPPKKAPQLPKS